LLAAKGYEFVSLNSSSSETVPDDLPRAHWLGTSPHDDAQESIPALSDQTFDWTDIYN
jgi:hypothetical protein